LDIHNRAGMTEAQVGAIPGNAGMITLIQFDHTLMRVAANAIALTRHASPARSRELQEGLQGLAWILSEEIQAVRTPAHKEARRQLRIETAALLVELETAQRDPTAANQTAVDHRARAWNALLQRVRLTLGLADRIVGPSLRYGPPIRGAAGHTGPAPNRSDPSMGSR